MRTNPHDPELPSHEAFKKTYLDNCWLLGRIGDATYLRSLMILRYGDREAVVELNLL